MAAAKETVITITAPNFQTLEVTVEGTAPFVQHKFSDKARKAIMATQALGTQSRSKKKREPRNFDADYKGAMHIAEQGWNGIPASAFRSAMIDACRLVGFKMTHAKLSIFVDPDGFDKDEGQPLVKINGRITKHETYARNDSGVVDIRVRPMWRKWNCKLRIEFDADQFSSADVYNLLLRAGKQVGVGEGRPNSKKSHGVGWGTFKIAEK